MPLGADAFADGIVAHHTDMSWLRFSLAVLLLSAALLIAVPKRASRHDRRLKRLTPLRMPG